MDKVEKNCIDCKNEKGSLGNICYYCNESSELKVGYLPKKQPIQINEDGIREEQAREVIDFFICKIL